MTKFRPHRGSLEEAMTQVQEFASRADLIAYIKQELDPYSVEPHPLERYDRITRIGPYTKDDRIGWDTHVVLVNGYGVFGFTDGPLL